MKVTAQIQILHTLIVVRDVLEYLWQWLSIMKRMIHPLFYAIIQWFPEHRKWDNDPGICLCRYLCWILAYSTLHLICLWLIQAAPIDFRLGHL